MSLDIISTQFSVVDAAQEGAMRTSQAANLRNCEIATLRNRRETRSPLNLFILTPEAQRHSHRDPQAR